MTRFAERFGVIVVAPLFDKERFPSARYQRGGLVVADGKAQPPEQWTYAVIPKIVAHVRALEAKPKLPCLRLGHSAGGQFLVRLAAFMPGDVVRIVAGNPGSHLFPDREQKFGYGFGGLPAELSNDGVMRRSRFISARATSRRSTVSTRRPGHEAGAEPAGARLGLQLAQGGNARHRARGRKDVCREGSGRRAVREKLKSPKRRVSRRAHFAGTIVTLSTSTRSMGVLFSLPPVGRVAMRSRTSSPFTSSP